MFEFVESEGLIDHVDPVQFTLRLLVPPGSALLTRSAITPYLGALDQAAFIHRWTHPDPRMDAAVLAAPTMAWRPVLTVPTVIAASRRENPGCVRRSLRRYG